MIHWEQYEAIIFDMDGVIIDSEPVWKIAMQEVFDALNCNLKRTDFEKTVGLRLDEVIAYWFAVRPWQGASLEEVQKQIIDKMVFYLSRDGQAITGVREALQFFKKTGLKIGLATSSYEVLIDAVLKKLEIESFFDYTHSAEHELFGKPHPAVYIHTAEKLGVSPLKCLVIEDSLNGIISGKAARMSVLCVPEKSHTPNPKLILADFHAESLVDVIPTPTNN